MAQLTPGPWGELKGKLGNLVVAKRNGKTIVQTKAIRIGKSSPAQLYQQSKFTAAVDFYRPISELVMVTFAKPKATNGAALARGNFLQNAISGEAPNLVIDYSKVKIAKGTLPLPLNPAASIEGTTITFTWDDNSIMASAQPSDAAVLVLHCPATKGSIAILDAARRGNGTATVNANVFAGQEVHTWLAFLRADKKKASDSIYIGKMNL
jgi:hypothetical protein